MAESILPPCFACARLRGVAAGRGWTCEAFDQIPTEILASSNHHDRPFPGDHGLTFKPRTTRETMPPVSESQRRAMFAAAAGHSTLGISPFVGREFAESDPGGHLPAHVAKDMSTEEFGLLRRLMNKFFGEESREPEHQEAGDSWEEGKHPRDNSGKFGSGSSSKHEHARASGVKLAHEIDLKAKGLKPKKRASNDAEGAISIAWAHAIETGKPQTVGVGGRGWSVVREGESVPYGTPHFTVTPDGKAYGFVHDLTNLGKDALNDERPWDRNGKAASVAFVTGDGRVLLVRRSAKDDHKPGEWCLPGGKANEGEDFHDCALREAGEEVGTDGWEDDGVTELNRVRTPNDWEHVTYGVPVTESFEPKLSDEHDDWTWCHPDGLPEPCHPGVRGLVDGIVNDGFNEGDHPRDNNGKFGSGGGTSGPISPKTTHAERVGIARERFAAMERKDARSEGYSHGARGLKVSSPHEAGEAGESPRAKGHREGLHRAYTEGYELGSKSRKAAHDVQDPSGLLSKKTREDIGKPGSEHREDMPESAFLEPEAHKYPVQERRDGKWVYTRNLLLAAARRARMEGLPGLASRADAIRAREFPQGGDAVDPNREIVGKLGNTRKGEPPLIEGALDGYDAVASILDRLGLVDSLTIAHDELAMDREPVRTIDDVGRMHVRDSVISKAVVSPYLGSEINGVMHDEPGWTMLDPSRKYHLLRDPEELRKAAHTFNGLPIVSKHIPTSANDHPTNLVVGASGTNAKFDGENLTNDLVIWPSKATQAVDDKSKESLSCGYGYKADMTPGTYKGQSYDGRMVNIVGNHIAQVERPRVPGSKVGGDSMPAIINDEWECIAIALLDAA